MNKTPANRTITADYLEKDQDGGQESDGESMGETIGIVDSGPMPPIVKDGVRRRCTADHKFVPQTVTDADAMSQDISIWDKWYKSH